MNPYPGLRPFQSSEKGWFFGREALDTELETRVHVSPLTLLFARSGVGKSSFLSCRFIPTVSGQTRITYVNEWGAVPPQNTVRAVIESLIPGAEDHLEKPVVVLDQFEDVFKLETSRDELWDTLAEFVNVGNNPVNVLISMREEWLGAWGEASDYLPSANVSMVRLAPLRDSEVLRAIMRPSAVEGSRTIAPELAKEIMNDLRMPSAFGLGSRYVEPGLIQIVCRRLWDEAATRGLKSIETALYDDLGRAGEMVRAFVWRQLRRVDTEEALFSKFDRVMFAGLIPHLSAAQGVKSIVTPTSLARKLRRIDLGVAGSAVLDYELNRKERAYLDVFPEKRGEPPQPVVTWVARVLNAGAEAGLLKRQRGMRQGEAIYELAHDSVSPILQQFVVEFEGWLRSRWYKLLGILFGALIVLPVMVLLFITLGWVGFYYLVLGLVVFALYIAFGWLMGKIIVVLLEALSFPILRRLIRGEVPDKRARNVHTK